MLLRDTKSIPVLIAGMLLLFTLNGSAESLANQLFLEKSWDACLRECHRISLQTDNAPSPRIRLLTALCQHHLQQMSPCETIQALSPLITQTNDFETAAIAAYEGGRLEWNAQNDQTALEMFAFAFQTATNRTLFLRSACSAFLLLKETPSLRVNQQSLIQQISTSRALWYGALFSACRPEEKRTSWLRAPAYGFIEFYRHQISPAIGQRCTLEPSCSEYFRRASCRHGLLAVPMMADRFFREPGLNNIKKSPVIINGMIRYRDPVDDHDFWMNR